MRSRFTKTAGSEFMPSVDDETMALVGDGPPDDVRLPPELGGHIEDVVDHFVAPCPHCLRTVRHLKLKTVYVAECDQFYWYRPKKCPHGNEPSDCTACDVAGDLAYDAAREDRY